MMSAPTSISFTSCAFPFPLDVRFVLASFPAQFPRAPTRYRQYLLKGLVMPIITLTRLQVNILKMLALEQPSYVLCFNLASMIVLSVTVTPQGPTV